MIPLLIQGVTLSFPNCCPTVEEFESLPHLSLTSGANILHDPANSTYANQEHALTQAMLETGDQVGAQPPSRSLCSVSKTRLFTRRLGTGMDSAFQSIRETSATFDDGTFLQSLIGISSLTKRSGVKNWGIDRQTARRTVDLTTQRGVRTVLYPTLSCRFRTNDRQLRYRRHANDCFTDTLISNTTSILNTKYAQIFATTDGWCRAYPIAKKKLDAHEGLSVLFLRKGVPNTIIMDGARGQTMSLFCRKCREAGGSGSTSDRHNPILHGPMRLNQRFPN